MKPAGYENLPLGRRTDGSKMYDPDQLCPVPRSLGRNAIGISDASFFYGEDIWNCWEVSWLTETGKPVVAVAEIRVPAKSPHIIESKSLKLYLNSFNFTRFQNAAAVAAAMTRDLEAVAGGPVTVRLFSPDKVAAKWSLAEPAGFLLDDLELTVDGFSVCAERIVTKEKTVTETLFSRLLRTNCPVTGQPDWATVMISYSGLQLDPSGVLAYLVGFREHTGFHENCVETIFTDLMHRAQPASLTVSARFTRRGGIDINPVRSTETGPWANIRDPRQ